MQILRSNNKSISLEQLPVEAWRNRLGQTDTELTALSKRCINYRADSLSTIPVEFYNLNGDEISEIDIGDCVLTVSRISILLKQIEKSLLKYSRAYILLEEMRILDASSITNVWDCDYGLVGYKRTVNGKEMYFESTDLLYFFEASESETVPERSSFDCAKPFVEAYNNVVEFVSAFFRNGTVKSTLLFVDGMPTVDERDRLKSFWTRAMRGVKNAFSVGVVRTKIEPISIGEGIESLDISILDNITQQVLLAYSVPASLVLPSAANFAVAEQDKFNFYDSVIIPRALYIQSVFNEGLRQLNSEIYFNYQSMQIYQKSEADRANSLAQLVNSGFTLLEAIDTIGYSVPQSMRKRLESVGKISIIESQQDYIVDLNTPKSDRKIPFISSDEL